MRYAGIDYCDLCNGNDIGMSLYVQGCDAHCYNCFNPETWDFNGGKAWDKETEKTFFNSIKRPYIKRITILGGEPMSDINITKVLSLVSNIKKLYPQKQIWIYTGFKLDELFNKYNKDNFNNVDYIVDGRYVDSLHTRTIPFRGSSNQNIWFNNNGTWEKQYYEL